jgi:hypothetical protein
MTTKVRRRVVAMIVAGVAALTLLAVNAAAALAAPTMLVNGRLMVLGSNGAVHFQPQNTSGTGSTVGMLIAGVAIIVIVGGLALILDRQSRSRLAAVPDQAAGDEWQTIRERQEVAGTQSSEQDKERKAA